MIDFDATLFLYLNHALSGPIATRFFLLITWLGDGIVLSLGILLPLYFFRRVQFRRHALAMVLAVAMGGLVVNLMKIAVNRPRPPEHFAQLGVDIHIPGSEPRDRSFPSGHTQTAFGAATYLSCLFPMGAPAFISLAALVGLSRIAIGVHFPADVLVGAFFGALFSIIGFYLNRRRLRKTAARCGPAD
ncbi:MAG: phosphatase PAP2 family protein [Deltaproteobacteria bacterium]|nr:phosphatase PAP2 family protein [Deltaproteobacteria bacterium]